MNDRSEGFTLLELLVALVVFGLLMAGLGQTLKIGLVAWQAQTRAIGRDGDLDAVDRVLRRLIARIAPDPGAEQPTIVGDATRFAFTSDLPQGEGTDGTRAADMAVALEGGQRLMLRWTPHRHAALLGAAPKPSETEILAGIAGVEFAYWTAAGGWRADWSDRTPPALVRVRLRFPPGDARHWPDIVAAPMLRWPNG